jgi:hypothetical protein
MMFQRIHRDVYSVLIAVVILAGAVAGLLAIVNPIK